MNDYVIHELKMSHHHELAQSVVSKQTLRFTGNCVDKRTALTRHPVSSYSNRLDSAHPRANSIKFRFTVLHAADIVVLAFFFGCTTAYYEFPVFFFIITTFPPTNLRPEQSPMKIIGKGEL